MRRNALRLWGRIGTCCVLAVAAAVLFVSHRAGVETDLYGLVEGRGAGLLRAIASGTAQQGRFLLEGRSVDALAARAAGIRQRLKVPPVDLSNTLETLTRHRAGLLAPAARARLAAGETRAVADAAVAGLFGLMPPLVSVKEDPFLLLTDYVMTFQKRLAPGWSLHQGDPVRTLPDGTVQLFFSLDLAHVPMSDRAAFLEEVEAGHERGDPVRVWCGGAVFHGARAAAQALREINVLSAVSALCVIALGWLLFRSFGFLPHLLTSVGAGLWVATACLFAVYPRPHALTFVFGTSLIGLGVDYVYHLRAAGAVSRIVRPLLSAFLTTSVCFMPFLFSETAVLGQMALFVLTGLATVCVWACAWMRPRAGLSCSPRQMRWLRPVPRGLTWALLCAAACGIGRVRFSSSPETFYRPDAFLARCEGRLMANQPSGTDAFVHVAGATVQEALEREERVGVHGLSAIIPSRKRQEENATLRARLYREEGPYLTAQTGIPVSAPVIPPPDGWLVPERVTDPLLATFVRTMTTGDGTVSPCPADFKGDAPGVTVIRPREAVREMFERLTRTILQVLGMSAVGLFIVLAFLFRRRLLLYVAPLGMVFLATAGLMGWCGVPITCFSLLCFFAVAGLSLDYIIFNRANASPVVRATVFCSFLTSFVGLGLLAFTHFAVTRAMGVTCAGGLFFAWLVGGLCRVEGPATTAWYQQPEQSAGRFRMLLMWYAYAWFGKNVLKALCVPVMACIYPFARPAREALRTFYGVLGVRPSHARLFRHLLGFAWAMADKTDAGTLRKALPRMTVRDDENAAAFRRLMAERKGVFLISSHLGTAEMLSALAPADAPHAHAFQQMGHDAVFTRVLTAHLDRTRLTLHPVEEIGVETAVRMQEAIAKGELVIMAGDRVSAGSRRELTHPFLGRRCVWPKGVFAFARLLESPIFFVTCVQTGWNAYAVHFRQFRAAHTRITIPDLLAQYVAFLEEETRARPDQWHQFYPFFTEPS